MKFKVPTLLLSLSIFFTGATGLVNEYILSTVSTYVLGNSIEQFSITIAIMLLFMGIGGFYQKYFNDNNLIEKFITIEILLAIFGSFAPIIIYAAFAYVPNHFHLVLYFLIAFIGFLVGFEIPFVTRINEKYSDSLKTNLAFIVSADYIGAFLGALIWVKLLLPYFHIFKIGFLISSVNFFVALLTFWYFRDLVAQKLKALYAFMIVLVFILLAYGYLHSQEYDTLIEQKLYADKIVYSDNTKYQHITITHNDILDEYRLYLNGNLQFSSLDEKRYHEFLVHPAMSLASKRNNILVLGGGDGLAVREIKKYNPHKITLVDLDPKMTLLSQTLPILKELNKNSLSNVATVDIINIDAMQYLHLLQDQKFDVVIIDLPDPNSIELNKLYTKEFYTSLQKALYAESIIAIQSSSSYFAKEVYLGIGRTLKASGLETVAYHHNIPSFGEWGFYLASKDKTLVHKLQNFSLKVQTNYLTHELLRASLSFGKDELHAQKNFINTMMNPQLYHEYINNAWLRY